jgi:Sel1 repeat-containing protein
MMRRTSAVLHRRNGERRRGTPGRFPWIALLAICVQVTAFAQQEPPPPPAAQPAAAAFETSELINTAHRVNAADLPRIRSSAEMGDARSQVLLGLIYEMGGAELMPEPRVALSWFLKAAAQGVTWAQVWAADFYFTGSPGVERDFGRALELYRSAAGRGDPKAAFFIGQMYFYGDGVTANHREAAGWYRRAVAADEEAITRMIELAEAPCDSSFCVGLRQVMGAVMGGSANRFIDGWDDARREWDANIKLPDAERCGLTSADRTSAGEVQNYFCDSAPAADETRGVAAARQLADEIQKALPAGYTRSDRSDVRPGPSTFFAKEGFPHVRVTYNVTPGSAQHRVTLLVGP